MKKWYEDSFMIRRMGQTRSSPLGGSATTLRKVKPEQLPERTREHREHLYGECDITILVKGYAFAAHREVLIENSKYFMTMLTQFEEKNHREVEIKDLFEPRIMGQVIHYMYFHAVDMKPSNVQELLQISTYLQMEKLQNTCVDFMKQRIDKRNCVSLYLYTLAMGPFDLQCHLEDFILYHFEGIAFKSKEFTSLSKEQLLRLISSDKLLVSSEGLVYRAVMRWIASDPKMRNSTLPSLLEHVHFPLMSLDEVEQSYRSHSVKKNPNLAKNLEEAKNYLSKNTKEKINYWSTKAKPGRWPKIFVTLRMYWKNLPMEYFDFRTKQWSVLCSVQNWRSCTALVSHGSQIYLIGGEEADDNSPTGSRTVNRVTRYDCEKQKWSSATSMCLARRWAASCVIDNVIYVIGGIGGRGGTYEKRLDSIECLDLTTRTPKWKLLSAMSTPRSSHTIEVMDGLIYVVGGGDGREWLNSAEVYNPKKNKWSSIAGLKSKRWKCGLVVLNGSLYAVGGMDSPKAGFWGAPLKSVEKYNALTDVWVEVSPMNEARFGCAVVAYQGKIYVSGGFGTGKAILNSTEVYDPETDRWTKLAGMKKMCGFVGGVIVDRPVHFDTGNDL